MDSVAVLTEPKTLKILMEQNRFALTAESFAITQATLNYLLHDFLDRLSLQSSPNMASGGQISGVTLEVMVSTLGQETI